MDDSWRSEAACATPEFKERARLAGAEKDPSQVFFPVTEQDDGTEFPQSKPRHKRYRLREARFERLARETCATCPVRLECLFYGMEHEQEPYGIFGALDPENRQALLDQDNPRMHTRVCACGIRLFGAKGHTPDACSANCRGAKQ